MLKDVSLFVAYGLRDQVRRRVLQDPDTARITELHEMPLRAEPNDSCCAICRVIHPQRDGDRHIGACKMQERDVPALE